jgi:hypothetical protein
MLGLAGDADADDPPMAGVHHQEPAATSPKVEPKASAEKKPAAAKASVKESTATPSEAQQSSSTPQPSEVKPPAAAPGSTANGKTSNGTADTRTMSEKLIDGMKQKQWKMADVKAFYVENVDKAGFKTPDDLNLEQRQQLWQAMIDKAGVIPF